MGSAVQLDTDADAHCPRDFACSAIDRSITNRHLIMFGGYASAVTAAGANVGGGHGGSDQDKVQ
jgi:hypothetical protein